MKVLLNNRTLHTLLRPVLPMTSNNWSLPVLERVVLQAHNGYLTASATDRFRIGVQRVKVEEGSSDEFRATLRRDDALKLLPLFKPNRRGLLHQAQLSVEVVDDKIVFESLPPDQENAHMVPAHEFEGMRLVVANDERRDAAEFPDIWNLTAKRLAKEAGERQAALVNFELLVGFREAAKLNADQSTAEISVTGNGNNDPLVVKIGEDFIGLLMPRRPSGEQTEGPAWQEFLGRLSAQSIEATKSKALSA